MKKVFKAEITYKILESHPDIKYVENPKEPLIFNDTYIIDTGYFYGHDHIIDYIKNDLMLVAGGGYNADHITDISFNIE